MALETEFANFTGNVAAWVSANAVESFDAKVVAAPLCTVENWMRGSEAKKFVLEGSVTASVTAESAAATKVEYTETSTTLTAQKATVYTETSVEATDFHNEDVLAKIGRKSGEALARKVDTDILGLSDGFSNSVGSTGVDLTPAVFATAAYTLEVNDVPGMRSCILHPISVDDLRQDLIAASAVVYNTETDLFNMQMKERSYQGSLFGIPIFSSTLVEAVNTNADRSGLMFTSQAIALVSAPSMQVMRGENVQSGLHEMNVYLHYQVGELKDEAGVQIVADHE